MAYIGIAFKMVLSRVNLPVYESIEEIPDNLLSNLETKGIRSSTDGLVVPKGRPKYVKVRLSTLQQNDVARVYASSF
jgi:hypothetical protein